MSYLEALSAGRCTRCFGCCYITVKFHQGLNPDGLDDTGILWIHVPVRDGLFNFLAVCCVAGIDDEFNPACLIQDEKPRICIEFECWKIRKSYNL